MSNSDLTAVYPGSFDPLTNGHDDIIRRGLGLVDHLIVAVARTATQTKESVFPVEERLEMIAEVYRNEPAVEVAEFSGLLVDFARDSGARLLIRGLRAVSDFEYEYQMALMNRSLWPEVEVIFMTPSLATTFLSASLVREVAKLGGDVSRFVPAPVLDHLAERFGPEVRGG
jgi:pantetheine-phosphate adenylyltransferase